MGMGGEGEEETEKGKTQRERGSRSDGVRNQSTRLIFPDELGKLVGSELQETKADAYLR